MSASFRPTAGASALLTLCALVAPSASAHAVSGETVGFLSGFEHPISGLDHVIAMIAVGLWGAQLGPPALWALPVVFPMIMAFGGFLGLIGVSLPASEAAIAVSGLCLGGVVAAGWRAPLPVAAALVGMFGLFHGYAHGAELPVGQNALFYSFGFVLATGLLHGCGIAIGLVQRWPWGGPALRAAGGLIACGGAYFLLRALT